MNSSQRALVFARLDYRAHEPEHLSQFYRHALGPDVGGDNGVLQFSHTDSARDPGGAGLFHVAFLYPDRAALATALLRLVALGIEIQGASDHDVSEAIYLEDPEGNGIELYADRPEELWGHESGIVRMGTRALDLDDLLAQAGEGKAELVRQIPRDTRSSLAERSQQIPDSLASPSGIVVGHVHLRSLDLQQSQTFWTDQFGLTVTSTYGSVASFLSAGGYHHHIAVNRFSAWTFPVEAAPGLERIVIERSDDGPTGTFESPEQISVLSSTSASH